jgi:proteic killer suppression protein
MSSVAKLGYASIFSGAAQFHGLQGAPKRYSVHVNGPWCITFEFVDGDALNVDFEQYH